MKFKLSAGADIDLLSPKEFSDGLQSLMRDWMVEAAKGPRAIRWSATGTVDSTGALTIGGDSVDVDSGRVGPEQSMVWSVKRLTVSALGNGKSVDIYINGINHLVVPGATGYNHFGSDEFVLLPGDKILVQGSGLTVGATIRITGSAWELPVTMMYRLL